LFQFLSTTRLPNGQASSHSTPVTKGILLFVLLQVSIPFNNPPIERAGIKSFNQIIGYAFAAVAIYLVSIPFNNPPTERAGIKSFNKINHSSTQVMEGFNSFQQPAYRTGRHQVIQLRFIQNTKRKKTVSIPFNIYPAVFVQGHQVIQL